MKAAIENGDADCAYNFFGGGGLALANGDSHEGVLGDLLSYPMYPFFAWEVVPLINFEEGVNKYIESYQRTNQ
jgi:hypothetical protein